MKKLGAIASAFVLLGCFFWLHTSQGNDKSELWSAITVSQPVFQQGRTENLLIWFAVVNDSNATVDPKIGDSHLFINGKELKDWGFIVANGPGLMYYDSLPPNKTVEFTKGMGDYFKTPGIYKLRWEGRNFRAPEITFRVTPKHKDSVTSK